MEAEKIQYFIFTPKKCWLTSDVYVRLVPYENTHGVHVGKVFLYQSVLTSLYSFIFGYVILKESMEVVSESQAKHFVIEHAL